MIKREVGEFLVQFGAFLLALPFLLIFLVSILYIISLIKFTIAALIIFACLAYLGLSVGLILYGKKLIK